MMALVQQKKDLLSADDDNERAKIRANGDARRILADRVMIQPYLHAVPSLCASLEQVQDLQ